MKAIKITNNILIRSLMGKSRDSTKSHNNHHVEKRTAEGIALNENRNEVRKEEKL